MNNDIIKFLFALLSSIFFFCNNNFAQEMSLLNEADMPEYILIRTQKIFWDTSKDPVKHEAIEQVWRNPYKDDIYISYCKFFNETDAIKGIASEANSYSMPSLLGSPTGELVGDVSWVSLPQHVIFSKKGNIGFRIFMHDNPHLNNKQTILEVSNKLLAKLSKVNGEGKDIAKYLLS